jgi:hypothetical protein
MELMAYRLFLGFRVSWSSYKVQGFYGIYRVQSLYIGSFWCPGPLKVIDGIPSLWVVSGLQDVIHICFWSLGLLGCAYYG